jgi:5-methylcytosine-specific restriction endonuclease McrA
MPYLPSNTKCAHLGCKEPRSKLNSYCLQHGGKDWTKTESASIYQTPAWKSIRDRQISIQPLCQACLLDGRVEMGKHVDHVFPWKHIGNKAFLTNVFQTLCPAHHSHKTAQEHQGNYEHYTATGIKVYTEHDYNTVVRENP